MTINTLDTSNIASVMKQPQSLDTDASKNIKAQKRKQAKVLYKELKKLIAQGALDPCSGRSLETR